MRADPRPSSPPAGPHLVGAGCMLVAMAWMTPAFAFVSPTNVDQMSASLLHHLLSMANTVFHEAGHWILAPLGRFMSVLGGSLFQVAIPVVAGVALWRSASLVGPPFALWWAGQSTASVARYIADARGGRLVLLGGHTGSDAPGTHDWRNLLTWTGLLERDVALGWLTHVIGTAAMVAGLVWLGWLCWQGVLVRLSEPERPG